MNILFQVGTALWNVHEITSATKPDRFWKPVRFDSKYSATKPDRFDSKYSATKPDRFWKPVRFDSKYRKIISCTFLWLLMATITIFGAGCSSPQAVPDKIAVDKLLEMTNKAAQQAFEKGYIDQAVTFYKQTLERAYLRDDLKEIVDAQYNLALCLMILQSYEQALAFISHAKVEQFLANQPISVDLQLLEATVFYRYGKPDEAWKITNYILSALKNTSVIQSKTHFLRGLIASKRGDTALLRSAITALGIPTEPKLRADREELL